MGGDFGTPFGGLTAEASISGNPLYLYENKWITTTGGITWGLKTPSGSLGYRFNASKIGIGFDGKVRFETIFKK